MRLLVPRRKKGGKIMLMTKLRCAIGLAILRFAPCYRPYQYLLNTPLKQLQTRMDELCTLRKSVLDAEFEWTCAAYLGFAGSEAPSEAEQRFVSHVLMAKEELEKTVYEREIIECLLTIYQLRNAVDKSCTTASRP